MRRRVNAVAALVLAAAPGWGQFALFTADSRQAGNELRVGSVPAGDAVTVRLKLRNVSAGAAGLTLLQVSGTGFAAEGVPALPLTLAAGAEVEFAVRFAPPAAGAYSASLRADSLSAILVGAGAAAPVVTVAEDGGWRTLASGMVVDFGEIERGAEARKRFAIANRNRDALPPMEVAAEGEGFSVSGAASAALGPGEAAAFEVVCAPASTGAREGTLRVGQRRFLLRAAGVEPPLPRPEIVVELAETRSARQGKVSVRFTEASRGRAEGALRIGFEPAVGTGDPGVVFADGGRTAYLSVAEGDAAARFGDAREARFQTGSTAGTLVFTLDAGKWSERQTVTVGPEPVGVSSSAAVRGTSSVEVTLAGYDNTRSASRLTYTFYDARGNAVEPGAIRVDGSAAFRQYFEASGLGGVFLLRAVFPVSGAPGVIDSVEAEVVNSAGSARTGRIRF